MNLTATSRKYAIIDLQATCVETTGLCEISTVYIEDHCTTNEGILKDFLL
jgi:hypothetical protein